MLAMRCIWPLLFAATVRMAPALAAGMDDLTFTYNDINTVVPGHPELRYSDLLRQLIPDLTLNEDIATGTAPSGPILHAMGRPFAAHFGQTVSFASFQTRMIEAEGTQRLLILTAAGPRTTPNDPMLLLAFSTDAVPRLLDVMDVSMGDSVSIGQPFRIGADDEAIVTTSDRAAAGETWSADTLLFMHDGKFDSVGGFFRFGASLCGFERTQTLDVTTQPAQSAGPYDDIEVTINDIGGPVDNGCDRSVGEAPYSNRYSALFQWNAALGTFAGDTTQIDALKDLNDARQSTP